MKALGKLTVFAPAILLLAIWELVVGGNPRLEFLFASPFLVGLVAREEMQAGAIWGDLFITASEAVLGLTVGSILGTSIGLILWTNEAVAKLARPYIVILGSIPIFAIAPMLIIWFGTGLLSKVVMSAFAVFFVALSQAYEGARYCELEHSQYAKTLNTPRRLMIRKIILPGAIRWVTAGLKISIGLALVGAFIGEFVSSNAGLGHFILTAGSLYDMPRVILGVTFLSLLALSLTAIVWGCERWKPQFFSR